MAAWCLPRNLSNAFLEAVKDGRLDPEKLMGMSSAQRRMAFAEHVGEENAAEVNAQFETKMLLKDQKAGLVAWANKIAGLSEPARRDILGTISKLDRVLQPEDERTFLADLAAKRLGVTVTAEEARQVYQLSQAAEAARTMMLQDINNVPNRVAYGRAVLDLLDRINEMKPGGSSFANTLINILNIPKTALTSIFHLSAPFVQGWGMLSTPQWWQGFGQMIQYLRSEENYRNLQAYIISHPDYVLARDGKLGLTSLGDRLTAREEDIQSSLIEGANRWLSERTGIPNLVRASSRAFTGYLNFVRFNRFVDLLNAARNAGEDVRPGSRVVSDLANVVNNFTGRGQLGEGDRYAAIGPVLNGIFFAPRKIVATAEMFNPVRYIDPRISATARRAAMRQLVGSILATGAVLTLAKAVGAQVDVDPRSQNFAKIQIGGEKLDMTGGNAVYVRLLARLITNQEITSKGKLETLGQQEGSFQSPSRAALVAQWARGKLSPVAGFLTDAFVGSDPVGRPFSMTQEIADKFTPIVIHSFIDYALNDPDNTAAILPSLTAIFGVGLESPLPPPSRSGRDPWGEPLSWAAQFGTPASWRNDPVNQEADRVGLYLSFPSERIRGQQLTADQYDDYVRLSGRAAHMQLSALVQSPGWQALPAPTRLTLMKKTIQESREAAATSIMLQNQGSANDILRKALAAKEATLAGQTVQ